MARILVIEDEPGIALGLQTDLQFEGHEVDVASDGEAGCERAKTVEFDLIILDVMLPKKDGFEVCRELRRAGLRMPIIMLTAKTQDAEKVLGLELGADDYVTKPFSPLELRARVKAALRRSQNTAPTVYRFGACEVDFTRFEARCGGRSINLTPLEFRLLSAFIRHRGRVLRRDELLDLAWGRDVYVVDRNIDTHVTNLRKKIERDPGAPEYLIGVRGIGYRFDG